jgi:hypothetical protein
MEAKSLKDITSLGGDTDPMFKAAGRIGEALRGPPLEEVIEQVLKCAANLITITGQSDECHLRQAKAVAVLSKWVQNFSDPEKVARYQQMRREQEQRMGCKIVFRVRAGSVSTR